MLTNSELNQIKNFLALYGKKDSQLSLIKEEELSKDETTVYLSIVQDNKNYRITLDLLRKAILEGLVEDDIYGIIDNQPVSGSRNLVRSGGVYNAINNPKVIHESQVDDDAVSTRTIQNNAVVTAKIADKNVTESKLSDDINNALSKFTNRIKVNNASSINREITVDMSTTATITIENNLEFFGDRPSSPVSNLDYENIDKNEKASEDIINGNTWNLEVKGNNPDSRVGAHTLTYTSTYSGVTPDDKSVTVNIYLRKFFGYSPSTGEDIPEIGDLPVEHASSSVSCTITINAITTSPDNKWRYIWFAVPSNMSIRKVVQDSTGYELYLHKFGNVMYETATRNIGGTNYSYKMYRSELKADCTLGTKLTIS